MVNTRKYLSGETPQSGDVVILKNNTNDWSGIRRNMVGVTFNCQYKVKFVSQMSKSCVIYFDDDDGYTKYATSWRFNLVHRDQKQSMVEEQEVPYYLITYKSTILKIKTETELNNKLEQILIKDPTAKIHIYEYKNSGVTDRPKVYFEYHFENHNFDGDDDE